MIFLDVLEVVDHHYVIKKISGFFIYIYIALVLVIVVPVLSIHSHSGARKIRCGAQNGHLNVFQYKSLEMHGGVVKRVKTNFCPGTTTTKFMYL